MTTGPWARQSGFRERPVAPPAIGPHLGANKYQASNPGGPNGPWTGRERRTRSPRT